MDNLSTGPTLPSSSIFRNTKYDGSKLETVKQFDTSRAANQFLKWI